MQNKVLVELIVPAIDEKYNLFLPINKRIGNIIILLNKALEDMLNGNYIPNDKACLYDKITGEYYDANIILRESNIRNGSVLILI